MKCFKYRSELHVIAELHIIVHEIAKVNNTVAQIHLHEKGKVITGKYESQRSLLNLSR